MSGIFSFSFFSARNQASWLYVGIDVCVRKAREGRMEGGREGKSDC